jgi:hypothetical protein
MNFQRTNNCVLRLGFRWYNAPKRELLRRSKDRSLPLRYGKFHELRKIQVILYIQ